MRTQACCVPLRQPSSRFGRHALSSAQNFVNYDAARIAAAAVVRAPLGDARVSWIDVRDIAGVLADLDDADERDKLSRYWPYPSSRNFMLRRSAPRVAETSS